MKMWEALKQFDSETVAKLIAEALNKTGVKVSWETIFATLQEEIK